MSKFSKVISVALVAGTAAMSMSSASAWNGHHGTTIPWLRRRPLGR